MICLRALAKKGAPSPKLSPPRRDGQALADGLKSNGSLKHLGLRNNSIGDAGAEALAAGLRENRSLKYLYLDESLRETQGGQALLEAEKMKKERGEDFDISWQLGFGSKESYTELLAHQS
eukprot:s374_g42.t1